MDYKLLLEKYMKHITQEEGIDFTDRLNDPLSSAVGFSVEEVAELRKISSTNDSAAE